MDVAFAVVPFAFVACPAIGASLLSAHLFARIDNRFLSLPVLRNRTSAAGEVEPDTTLHIPTSTHSAPLLRIL